MLQCGLCDFTSNFRFTMETHLKADHEVSKKSSLPFIFDNGEPLLISTPFGVDNSTEED